MKRFHPALPCLLLTLVIVIPALRAEEDTVTIPKSRLEELERKAAELDNLQGELKQSRAEQENLRQAREEADRKAAEQIKAAAAAKAEAEKTAEHARVVAAAAYTAAPMESLPPLKPGQPVSSVDLLAHYAADPVAAGTRYGKGRITVEGEIVGFSKPPFIRPYELLLKTADPARRVVCGIEPPGEYKAVYPAKSGTVLVGITTRGDKVTLLQVGQPVVIEGQCGGLHGPNVTLDGCILKSAL
ncbi:MAG: hypothetical protein ABSH14_13800 [Verrucomicrobiia bacterium]|jgi:beta-glucosidase-like glycosyl hydrolase